MRDKFIGWAEEKKLKRLKYITNNMRFLILPWVRKKNLPSKILSKNLRRLKRDYEEVYGHSVYLAETFVDLRRYKGICYRAANFIYLGETRGFSRRGKRYYNNGRPKGVFVYPLVRDIRKVLNGEILPYGGEPMKGAKKRKIKEMNVEGLMEVIKKVTDPRKRRGVRYPIYSLLGLAVCAVLCGARSYRAIGEWVKNVAIEVLKRFGIERGTYPDESTIRRAIQKVDVDEFDRLVSNWLIKKKIIELKGRGIAIDGKSLRGSRDGDGKAVHLLSAILHKEGVVIGSRKVGEKTNEIKAVPEFLEGLEIEGAVVTMDAFLAQKELAKYIKEEKGADYIVTIKGNKKTILEDIKDYFRLESFPPSAQDDR